MLVVLKKWMCFFICLSAILPASCEQDVLVDIDDFYIDRPIYVSFASGLRCTIKGFNQSEYKNGFRYLAFFSGASFNGRELHVARIGKGHIWSGERGVLLIFEIKEDGKVERFYPDLNYDIIRNEVRDPNICVSRNGQYLLLSTYACDKTPKLTGSYLYLLDERLSIVSANYVSKDITIWGNTLETPEHYLLKTGYKDDKIYILKSREKITESIYFSFDTVNEFQIDGLLLSEATMAYVGDQLVLIMRTSQNSFLINSYEQEGTGQWSEFYNLGATIHSPAMVPYQDGDVCVFSGGYVVSNAIRTPCIGEINMRDNKILELNIVENNQSGFGGYPSLIELSPGLYSMMYYDDCNNYTSAVYYRRIKLNK